MSNIINAGISSGILVLFIVVIAVGYVYIEEGRKTQERMNATLTNITDDMSNVIDQITSKAEKDNIRFNATLDTLSKTYNLIVDNQRLIINSSNQSNTLIKFLADNFGAQSGYLERENFQYDRANKTFDMITAIYNKTR